ncbi:unnamed protein product [Vitrella brassicaformis CCMP3155]|uniref:Uncharacterized protein n=1 Tax=Vitrella brassicaformis (strain CCMP3155) TaxID=1169540 RepID=A0A0G4FTV0_VITBC|nr:unnamed protein product [Vitrella brassicaformis CCMP3155]|eukprot:CEM18324.1 unnamed protein product [Vitrella brassicaformis CCMP3155]
MAEDVFEHTPEALGGQQGGPLARLEDIGTIAFVEISQARVSSLQVPTKDRTVVAAVQCSLSLAADGRSGSYTWTPAISPSAALAALDRLVGTCCRPNAPIILDELTTADGGWEFDLSIFDHPEFPSHPSPGFETMIQQMAREADGLQYIFTQQGLTDPHTSPSPSAIEIASILSFDNLRGSVEVKNDWPDFNPPANTPSPHPAIISHLQPFPSHADRLSLEVSSNLGGPAGRLLAAKMPKKVGRVDIGRISSEEKVGVLTALGREREVNLVVGLAQVDVDQLVEAADGLPMIKTLAFTMTLPDDGQSAASAVHNRLLSLIPRIRGLQYVTLTVPSTTAEQHDSINSSLPVGTNIEGLSITGVGHDRGDTCVEMAAPSDA